MSQLGLSMTSDERSGGRGNGRGGGRATLVAGIVVVVVIVVAAVVAVRAMGGSSGDFTGDGDGPVTVEIAKGSSLRKMGEALAAAGVVKTADAFVDAADAEPKSGGIAPGAYNLRLGMSGTAAVAAMLDPASRDIDKLVLPEGLRLSQSVTAAAKATGLAESDLTAALRNPAKIGLPSWAGSNPEGFLFPATYELAPGADATAVVATLVRRFGQAAAETGLVAGAAARGVTPYEALIVASLVQGEGVVGDYPKVARVIYNRLAKGMPLQLDSTVNYALGTTDLQLSADQLRTASPYNTYVHRGLPPGPINSPGAEAIEAALEPAQGNWLYFVTVDPKTGETKFTANYDEFLAFKQEYRANTGS
ncbi:MAG: endolytic transglycosylase MltG [Actinomycetota bacterium]|nr:MAG: endolytic transglycosylase MltG [Actinomycetota bacterium]